VPSTDPSTPVNVPPVNVPPLPPTPDESVQQLQNQAPPALPRGDAPSPREAPPLTGVTTTSVSTAVTIVAKGARKPVPAAKARSLPLTGTHACLLDDKKGLTLPKTLREQLGEFDTLFVTPGADGSLWLTTACGLEKLTDKMEKGPQAGEEGRVHRRRYLAQTERVTVDKTGYVILTPALMQAAGVKQDLLLIGVGDHLELWETQRWKKFTEMEGAEGE
jgi:MraZ protein